MYFLKIKSNRMQIQKYFQILQKRLIETEKVSNEIWRQNRNLQFKRYTKGFI